MTNSRDVDKFERLIHLNEVYWQQWTYHREKEYRIFVWTSAILITGIGGLFVGFDEPQSKFRELTLLAKLVLTLIIFIWIGLSVWAQKRERNFGNDYIAVLISLADELGAFEGDDLSILPNSWKSWSRKRESGFMFSYLPITITLGAVCITLVLLGK